MESSSSSYCFGRLACSTATTSNSTTMCTGKYDPGGCFPASKDMILSVGKTKGFAMFQCERKKLRHPRKRLFAYRGRMVVIVENELTGHLGMKGASRGCYTG
jgi:hypothetical protein